jgi:hypothetical protein
MLRDVPFLDRRIIEGIEIVHDRHPVALAKQAIHQMTPNESGSAGD